MAKIPKSFKLFATEVKVVIDDKRTDDLKAYGYYENSTSTITLANKDGISDLSECRKLDAFYHERTHAILEAMHEHELSNNEKFVDTFSKLLRQSIETQTF